MSKFFIIVVDKWLLSTSEKKLVGNPAWRDAPAALLVRAHGRAAAICTQQLKVVFVQPAVLDTRVLHKGNISLVLEAAQGSRESGVWVLEENYL